MAESGCTDFPLSLQIYDLTGELVHELPVLQATSGEFRQSWNGRDGAGQLVPPGIYVYRLRLRSEVEQVKVGTFGVLY